MENSRCADEFEIERCLVSQGFQFKIVNLINLLIKVITFNK